MESAALLEPLSVAIHATRRGTIQAGNTVIVFGAGTIGMLVGALAKQSGATKVLIADIDAGRVAFALKHGFATDGYVVSLPQYDGSTEEKLQIAKDLGDDAVEKCFSRSNLFDDEENKGADVVFDCTGKEVCTQAGIYVSFTISDFQALANWT
jgi:L-iditol 2-dehydrogenase